MHQYICWKWNPCYSLGWVSAAFCDSLEKWSVWYIYVVGYDIIFCI